MYATGCYYRHDAKSAGTCYANDTCFISSGNWHSWLRANETIPSGNIYYPFWQLCNSLWANDTVGCGQLIQSLQAIDTIPSGNYTNRFGQMTKLAVGK